MFAGIAAVVLAVLLPGLVHLFMLFVWLPLTLIIRLAEGMATFSWASFSLSEAGLDNHPSFAVLWYAGIGLVVYLLERFRKRYVLGVDH
jgi:hypothetical protein